jgi:hypothetical protein
MHISNKKVKKKGVVITTPDFTKEQLEAYIKWLEVINPKQIKLWKTK